MDAIQALVEILANVKLGEASRRAAGRLDALQARVEVAAKRQTLHAAGYMDAIQALVEILTNFASCWAV